MRAYSSRKSGHQRTRPSARPRLEVLEDRMAPAVFIVTTDADSGVGSLRRAINQANANPGSDVIQFDLTTGTTHSIDLQSALPAVTDTVHIDGTSQPDYTVLPKIVLNGTNAGAGANGLVLQSGASTVRALAINNFAGSGVVISSVDGGAVYACRIGVNHFATGALPNGRDGVEILAGATGCRIGGSTANTRNVISGNARFGISITGASGSFVQGNFIGTDRTATNAIANGSGIAIRGGATGNIVGGSSGAQNVISGNDQAGVLIVGGTTANNRVQGNIIGTDLDQSAALANVDGVRIAGGAHHNLVGGPQPEHANVISGNMGRGVDLREAGTTANVVRGNLIGLNGMGESLGNSRGVVISEAARANTISANTISSNVFEGVLLDGPGTNGNLIAGNRIGTDVGGTVSRGNGTHGVCISSGARNTVVGGTTTASRNVISANGENGILVYGPGTNGTVIQGNYIGTDATGTADLGNDDLGILVSGLSTNTRIGGAVAGARNVISGNGYIGISVVAGSTGTVISGNRIGTNAAGSAAIPNVTAGILVSEDNTRIGGTSALARNVISGNDGYGVFIQSGATGTVVRGNYFGTNAAGTAVLANTESGIFVTGGATNTIIGGAGAGARNVISGNGVDGITVVGSDTTGTVIRGNYVGTNAAGTADLGNGRDGIGLRVTSTGTVVGGATAASRNVISGNGLAGISIASNSTGNRIQGNFIGTDATGTTDVGNTVYGIAVVEGATDNRIGSTIAGTGNRIAFNGVGVLVGMDSVHYGSGAGIGNSILRNSIFNSDSAGISHGMDPAPFGTTPPILTQAVSVPGTGTVINGNLTVVLSGAHRVEFFTDPNPDASGAGEGKVFLGALTFTPTDPGIAQFSAVLPTVLAPGRIVTATVTDPQGNTTTFALNDTVV